MDNKDKVSIIVLSYNNFDITKKFIDLLYKNTSKENFNLILIDNFSTDNSVEYINSLDQENIVKIFNEKNEGIINGRNIGYNYIVQNDVECEYICFLDNDQFVQENWLNDYLKFLNNGEYDIIGAEAWRLSKIYWPMHRIKRPGEPFSYVGCGGMLMKKEVPLNIGMFDERFNPCYFEDPDFNFRAIDSGYRIGWNYGAKIVHLAHQTLGKNPDRINLLKSSHKKFQNKWKNRKETLLIQNRIHSD